MKVASGHRNAQAVLLLAVLLDVYGAVHLLAHPAFGLAQLLGITWPCFEDGVVAGDCLDIRRAFNEIVLSASFLLGTTWASRAAYSYFIYKSLDKVSTTRHLWSTIVFLFLSGALVSSIWFGLGSSLHYSKILEDIAEDYKPDLDFLRVLCFASPLLHLVASLLILFSGRVEHDEAAVKANTEAQSSYLSKLYIFVALALTLTLGVIGHIGPMFLGGSKAVFTQMELTKWLRLANSSEYGFWNAALTADASVLMLLLAILFSGNFGLIRRQTIYSFVSYIAFSLLLVFYANLTVENGNFKFSVIFLPPTWFLSYGDLQGVAIEIAIFAFNWAIFGFLGVLAYVVFVPKISAQASAVQNLKKAQ